MNSHKTAFSSVISTILLVVILMLSGCATSPFSGRRYDENKYGVAVRAVVGWTPDASELAAIIPQASKIGLSPDKVQKMKLMGLIVNKSWTKGGFVFYTDTLEAKIDVSNLKVGDVVYATLYDKVSPTGGVSVITGFSCSWDDDDCISDPKRGTVGIIDPQTGIADNDYAPKRYWFFARYSRGNPVENERRHGPM